MNNNITKNMGQERTKPKNKCLHLNSVNVIKILI